jgi:pilus assembly protein CpaC
MTSQPKIAAGAGRLLAAAPLETGATTLVFGKAVSVALGAVLACLCAPLAARAQAPPPTVQPIPVAITVQLPQARSTQLITVPVNQGALVDLSIPVREVRVANPEIADVTALGPQQLLVSGKSYGTTQLLVVVDGGTQQVFTVAVDLDLDRLRSSIRLLVPRAKVEVSGLLDAIVLSGTVPDIESAERIKEIAGIYSKDVINHLRVAGVYQVLLRCTVAEVNRAATRELGFNGWMGGDNFKDMFAVNNIAGINPSNIGAPEAASMTRAIPFVVGQDGIPITASTTLSLGFPRVEMQLFLQALRENGLLRVLAEPNLVAISGQEANFLAGGELPIPVPQSGQSGAITIEYREYGVRLKFTPTVLSENVIRLKVAPEVSEPDYSTAIQLGGFTVPGLIKRDVQTVVELGPGQTFAIGGLLSEKTRATSSKVPALGDLPVLGSLFSSVSYQSSESELVVLVTPELVAPLNPDQIKYLPGTDHIAPNDWELFGLGKIEGEGRPGAQANAPAAPEDGSFAPSGTKGKTSALRLRGPVGLAGGEEGS